MHSFKKNYTRRMFRYVLRTIILTTLLTRIISYYLFLIKALESRYALLLKRAKDIDYA